MLIRRHQALEQSVCLDTVDTAIKQRQIPTLPRQRMNHRESVHVRVFKPFQCLSEYDAPGLAISVHQCEPASRLALKCSLDDGHQGRDTTARCKGGITFAVTGVQRHIEMPDR